MSENQTEVNVEEAPRIDPIESIHEACCPSLSGRSTLTYAVGRHKDDGTLHLRADFSDRGRLFQADRGRRFSAIVDAQGMRASEG